MKRYGWYIAVLFIKVHKNISDFKHSDFITVVKSDHGLFNKDDICQFLTFLKYFKQQLFFLKSWAICDDGISVMLVLQFIQDFKTNKCSSFQNDHAFIIEPKNWIALNDYKTATDSPRWYITACVPEAGDDIYRKKEPLSSTVDSLK